MAARNTLWPIVTPPRPTSGTKCSPMVAVRLKYVYRSKDRQGRDRWLLRLPGRRAVTLKGVYGSPEFMANYHDATEQQPQTARASAHGTVAALVHLYFANNRFTRLAAATQKSQRNYLERV